MTFYLTLSISGDIKWYVPSVETSISSQLLDKKETPKSANLAFPILSSKIFYGFISLWIILF